jgi:DNA-binding CsgD family transcriptional regulator
MDVQPQLDYRQAFMSAPAGLCVSRRRVIVQANARLESILRYPPGQLNNTSFDALYPTQREMMRGTEGATAALNARGIYACERIMKRLDDELFWCRLIGRSLTPAEPLALCIWTFEDLSTRHPVSPDLSDREREIALLIAEGKTSKMVARHLNLSPRTVEMYRSRLMAKFSTTTSSGLAGKLMRPGEN